MQRLHRFGVILAAVAIVGSLLAGCGSKPGATGGADLRGTITVSGAWALYPMMVRWGEEFQKLHPQVQFDISAGGAGKGMADALAGAVELGMVSRDVAPEEEARGAFWVAVCKDAVFPAVNEQNPVLADLRAKGVSREIFLGIYITGQVITWGQVVGRPEVTDPIHVYTRSDAAGAPDTWAKYLGKKQEDLKGIGVYGDPGLLDAVVKDPLGIGYNNLNYAFDAKTGKAVAGAVALPIDANGNGKADPDEVIQTKAEAVKAVATGKYPSPPARLLNLVTKGKPSGLVREFLLWTLTDGQKFLDEAGYVALTPDQAAAGREKLK
jgi:phosphate transport system substrate-binding protein